MPQLQLPIFPHGTTEINQNIGIIREKDQVIYIYGHLPIFTHHVEDVKMFRIITSQMYINGSIKQAEICREFGVPASSVKRYVKIYKEKGIEGFFEKREVRGEAVLTPEVIERCQELFDEGLTKEEVAEKLGIKKDTLRKAIKDGRIHVKKRIVKKRKVKKKMKVQKVREVQKIVKRQ